MSHARRTTITKGDFARFDDGLNEGWDTPLECPEPSLTRQSELASTDINIIMKRYNNNINAIPQEFLQQGVYGDVTDVPDYQEAMNRIAYAEQYFATLPIQIRERFAYNPASFLDFMANPDNQAEAVDLGIIEAPPTPAAPPAPTPPAPSAPPTGSGSAPVV